MGSASRHLYLLVALGYALAYSPAFADDSPASPPLVKQAVNAKLCNAIVTPPANRGPGVTPPTSDLIQWDQVRAMKFDFWLPDYGAASSQEEAHLSTQVPDDTDRSKAALWTSLDKIGGKPVRGDFDNSGSPQWALTWHYESHAGVANFYFVYSDASLKHLDADRLTYDAVLQNADFAYPWAWEKLCKSPHPDCEYDDDLLFSTTDYSGDVITFRAQYMSLDPFSYGGSTYFLLTTEDVWASHIAYVIRPAPDGKYEVTCTFESKDKTKGYGHHHRSP